MPSKDMNFHNNFITHILRCPEKIPYLYKIETPILKFVVVYQHTEYFRLYAFSRHLLLIPAISVYCTLQNRYGL